MCGEDVASPHRLFLAHGNIGGGILIYIFGAIVLYTIYYLLSQFWDWITV